VPQIRYPLGLPQGSVRAILALMIAGLFWLVLVLAETQPVQVPLFLYFLSAMILVFFAAHGTSIGVRGPSPLGLPRGVLRTALLLGAAGVLGWMYYQDPSRLPVIVTPVQEQLHQWPTLLATTIGGFVFGHVIGRGPWRRTAGFQDILAWVALIAMIMLVVETILVVFINPRVRQELNLGPWEAVLTALVTFYFGARS
jgi:hypothetical protein